MQMSFSHAEERGPGIAVALLVNTGMLESHSPGPHVSKKQPGTRCRKIIIASSTRNASRAIKRNYAP